jgi:hypothetical protein
MKGSLLVDANYCFWPQQDPNLSKNQQRRGRDYAEIEDTSGTFAPPPTCNEIPSRISSTNELEGLSSLAYSARTLDSHDASKREGRSGLNLQLSSTERSEDGSFPFKADLVTQEVATPSCSTRQSEEISIYTSPLSDAFLQKGYVLLDQTKAAEADSIRRVTCGQPPKEIYLLHSFMVHEEGKRKLKLASTMSESYQAKAASSRMGESMSESATMKPRIKVAMRSASTTVGTSQELNVPAERMRSTRSSRTNKVGESVVSELTNQSSISSLSSDLLLTTRRLKSVRNNTWRSPKIVACSTEPQRTSIRQARNVIKCKGADSKGQDMVARVEELAKKRQALKLQKQSPHRLAATPASPATNAKLDRLATRKSWISPNSRPISNCKKDALQGNISEKTAPDDASHGKFVTKPPKLQQRFPERVVRRLPRLISPSSQSIGTPNHPSESHASPINRFHPKRSLPNNWSRAEPRRSGSRATSSTASHYVPSSFLNNIDDGLGSGVSV